MTAELLMLASSIVALLVTVLFVRSRQLRVKYAVMWLALAFGLAIVGTVPELLKEFARSFQLSIPAAVLFAALTVIYLFSMSLSVSASRHHQEINVLSQEIAVLKNCVEMLKEKRNENSGIES